MKGDEIVTIKGIADLKPRQDVEVLIEFPNGEHDIVLAKLRIDTQNELDYFNNGGILHYVLRNLASEAG